MNRRNFISLMALMPSLGFAKWRGTSPTISPLVGYLRTNWSKDPFSYGSYSYLAKNSSDSDRVTLSQPINNRVFFAGEALNPKYQSNVQAAHESGIISANQILAAGHKQVAIVGAGMSGLSAAHYLSKQGITVTVYEGRERIGGRIWTDSSLGAALDLGASWIHGPIDNPISELSDQVDLKRIETGDKTVIRGKDRRKIRSWSAPEWLDEVEIQTSMGTETASINMEEYDTMFDKHGEGYEGRDVIFPCGYDEVFESLKGDYEVKLAHPVNLINHNKKGVELASNTGTFNSVDAVLVTVPLGVLKSGTISFEPALQESKQQAIARMGMGTLDKVYLLFEETFWDEDATWIVMPENDLPRGQFNVWLNLHKYLNKPILLAFNGGKPATELSALEDKEIVSLALKAVSTTYS